MTKHINRRWALALIAASMFGTAGATIAAAGADARPMLDPCQYEKCIKYPPPPPR